MAAQESVPMEKAKTNAGERTLAQFIVLNKEYNSCFFKFTEQ